MTQLQPTRMEFAEYKRTIHRCQPEAGTPFEVLLNPGYWAHVSARMRPGDRVEVWPPERSYYAELIVLEAGKLFARVEKLHYTVLQKGTLDTVSLAAGEFEARWMGAELQWCIVRGDDRIKSGLSKDEAVKEIESIAGAKPKKVEPKQKTEAPKAA